MTAEEVRQKITETIFDVDEIRLGGGSRPDPIQILVDLYFQYAKHHASLAWDAAIEYLVGRPIEPTVLLPNPPNKETFLKQSLGDDIV